MMISTSPEGWRSSPIVWPSAQTLLLVIIVITLWCHYDDRLVSDFWHSPNHYSVSSTIKTLFSHCDWEHVVENMFLLWFCGRRVFVGSSWSSPMAFLFIYFGSQFASVCGCQLLSQWLNRSWKNVLKRGRFGWSPWVPVFFRDAWSTISYAPQIAQLRLWQFSSSSGASAAVCGVVGAHLYTANVSSRHPSTMDVLTKILWLGFVWTEVAGTPLSLEQLSKIVADRIDHAAHLSGLIGGFILAWVWENAHSLHPEEGKRNR